MKVLVLLAAVAAALAVPSEVPHTAYDYHERYGIEAASRILAAESALDFDGARIVGGSTARLGQYPHMGGLVITMTTGATSVCGSSLVSNTRAVTAAHCWNDGRNQARQYTVVLGSVLLFSGGTRVSTSNVQMHPSWNPRTADSDLAIIVIPRVNYSANINRITLATGSNLFVGSTAIAVGFGRNSDGAGIGQGQQLHHVQLPVISNADCARVFGNTITARIVCTSGAGGRSTCGGDSGGPLQLNNQLIGITSFGSALGCQRGFPAAFTRVTAFATWIQSRM